MKQELQLFGNMGVYQDSGTVLSFQMGDTPSALHRMPSVNDYDSILPWCDMQYSTLNGFNVLWRGMNNHKCEEIEIDIKKNRLLPTLIKKQTAMLYGMGIMPYKPVMEDGKFKREWEQIPEVQDWLESWGKNGIEITHKEFARTIIKNYYTFGDYFVKYRFTEANSKGLKLGKPLAGMEAMEVKQCRLATMRKDVATGLVNYSDFRFVGVGRWNYSISNFVFYPRFKMEEADKYQYAAVGHYRDKSVGEYYGINETHTGTQAYIKGSNQLPVYINSFLENSLAAKKHVKIPYEWIRTKQQQITRIAEENKKLAAANQPLVKFNGIEIGTEYKESVFIAYVKSEMNKLVEFLSGSKNQGKTFSSYTYSDSKGTPVEWKIEDVDMKYKEYISALIEYDKRADEVLVSSLGIDSSISSISKDGVISKSGADVYYNYLIYLLQLNGADEICSEPFNVALQLNFPNLYAQGYRLGYYREMPARQEEVSPANRLNQQQL